MEMRDHKDLMESFRVLYQMQKDYILKKNRKMASPPDSNPKKSAKIAK
jgi:hypothetical protein